MKILITGASGFLGSFLVEESLRRGYDTWAAVRESSSRRYLCDGRIRFLVLDMSSREQLTEALSHHQFDYVIHAAGLTKCTDRRDFYRTNTDGTRHLVEALQATQTSLRRFVFISSLSVFGAIREAMPYSDIRDDDTPQPNTDYGRSKLAAERYLAQTSMPYVILRPTGIYGPRERDYFMMAQSIKNHLDFAVGYRRQDITFVYVTDVVAAAYLALEKGRPGSSYFLSDGEVYQSSAFSDYIHESLGRPWWIRITAPLWLLRVVTFFGEYVGRITGHVSALNNDKYNILRQRNWRCDISAAVAELGYSPKVKLREGVEQSIAWYKDNGWL